MTMPAPDYGIGSWNCAFCGSAGRHTQNCTAPTGRCGRCGFPIDEHSGVDTTAIQCPKRGVPA